MSEFYEFEGTTYEVGPNRLEDFMKKFPNATKIQDPASSIITRPINPEGFKESPLLEGDGILTFDEIEQQKRDAFVEKTTRENLLNYYSNVTKIPKLALPYVTNLTGGAASLISGRLKAVEATY